MDVVFMLMFWVVAMWAGGAATLPHDKGLRFSPVRERR